MEIGGNDQLFNMMMGRHLQKRIQNKEKFVLSVPILADSKGTKIGKTLGNVIPFGNDDPYSTYAGIMSLGDDCVINCMVAITDLGLEEISIFETEMNKNGANPMKYKKLLAYTVVQENYSEEIAKECQDEFEKTVQGKDFSEEQVMSIEFKENERILDFLKRGLTELSNSRIKEVIEQGGLEINGAKVTNMNQMVTKGIQIKFGKKTYLKAN
jgi:tyrosyl-tRNA synthetase